MKPLGTAIAICTICTISTLAGCGTGGSASPTLHDSMGSYTLADCSNGGGLTLPSIKVTFTNTTSATESVFITLSDSNGYLISEVGTSGGSYADAPVVRVRPGGSFSQVQYIPSESDLCGSHPYVSDTTK